MYKNKKRGKLSAIILVLLIALQPLIVSAESSIDLSSDLPLFYGGVEQKETIDESSDERMEILADTPFESRGYSDRDIIDDYRNITAPKGESRIGTDSIILGRIEKITELEDLPECTTSSDPQDVLLGKCRQPNLTDNRWMGGATRTNCEPKKTTVHFSYHPSTYYDCGEIVQVRNATVSDDSENPERDTIEEEIAELIKKTYTEESRLEKIDEAITSHFLKRTDYQVKPRYEDILSDSMREDFITKKEISRQILNLESAINSGEIDLIIVRLNAICDALSEVKPEMDIEQMQRLFGNLTEPTRTPPVRTNDTTAGFSGNDGTTGGFPTNNGTTAGFSGNDGTTGAGIIDLLYKTEIKNKITGNFYDLEIDNEIIYNIPSHYIKAKPSLDFLIKKDKKTGNLITGSQTSVDSLNSALNTRLSGETRTSVSQSLQNNAVSVSSGNQVIDTTDATLISTHYLVDEAINLINDLRNKGVPKIADQYHDYIKSIAKSSKAQAIYDRQSSLMKKMASADYDMTFFEQDKNILLGTVEELKKLDMIDESYAEYITDFLESFAHAFHKNNSAVDARKLKKMVNEPIKKISLMDLFNLAQSSQEYLPEESQDLLGVLDFENDDFIDEEEAEMALQQLLAGLFDNMDEIKEKQTQDIVSGQKIIKADQEEHIREQEEFSIMQNIRANINLKTGLTKPLLEYSQFKEEVKSNALGVKIEKNVGARCKLINVLSIATNLIPGFGKSLIDNSNCKENLDLGSEIAIIIDDGLRVFSVSDAARELGIYSDRESLFFNPYIAKKFNRIVLLDRDGDGIIDQLDPNPDVPEKFDLPEPIEEDEEDKMKIPKEVFDDEKEDLIDLDEEDDLDLLYTNPLLNELRNIPPTPMEEIIKYQEVIKPIGHAERVEAELYRQERVLLVGDFDWTCFHITEDTTMEISSMPGQTSMDVLEEVGLRPDEWSCIQGIGRGDYEQQRRSQANREDIGMPEMPEYERAAEVHFISETPKFYETFNELFGMMREIPVQYSANWKGLNYHLSGQINTPSKDDLENEEADKKSEQSDCGNNKAPCNSDGDVNKAKEDVKKQINCLQGEINSASEKIAENQNKLKNAHTDEEKKEAENKIKEYSKELNCNQNSMEKLLELTSSEEQINNLENSILDQQIQKAAIESSIKTINENIGNIDSQIQGTADSTQKAILEQQKKDLEKNKRKLERDKKSIEDNIKKLQNQREKEISKKNDKCKKIPDCNNNCDVQGAIKELTEANNALDCAKKKKLEDLKTALKCNADDGSLYNPCVGENVDENYGLYFQEIDEKLMDEKPILQATVDYTGIPKGISDSEIPTAQIPPNLLTMALVTDIVSSVEQSSLSGYPEDALISPERDYDFTVPLLIGDTFFNPVLGGTFVHPRAIKAIDARLKPGEILGQLAKLQDAIKKKDKEIEDKKKEIDLSELLSDKDHSLKNEKDEDISEELKKKASKGELTPDDLNFLNKFKLKEPTPTPSSTPTTLAIAYDDPFRYDPYDEGTLVSPERDYGLDFSSKEKADSIIELNDLGKQQKKNIEEKEKLEKQKSELGISEPEEPTKKKEPKWNEIFKPVETKLPVEAYMKFNHLSSTGMITQFLKIEKLFDLTGQYNNLVQNILAQAKFQDIIIQADYNYLRAIEIYLGNLKDLKGNTIDKDSIERIEKAIESTEEQIEELAKSIAEKEKETRENLEPYLCGDKGITELFDSMKEKNDEFDEVLEKLEKQKNVLEEQLNELADKIEVLEEHALAHYQFDIQATGETEKTIIAEAQTARIFYTVAFALFMETSMLIDEIEKLREQIKEQDKERKKVCSQKKTWEEQIISIYETAKDIFEITDQALVDFYEIRKNALEAEYKQALSWAYISEHYMSTAMLHSNSMHQAEFFNARMPCVWRKVGTTTFNFEITTDSIPVPPPSTNQFTAGVVVETKEAKTQNKITGAFAGCEIIETINEQQTISDNKITGAPVITPSPSSEIIIQEQAMIRDGIIQSSGTIKDCQACPDETLQYVGYHSKRVLEDILLGDNIDQIAARLLSPKSSNMPKELQTLLERKLAQLGKSGTEINTTTMEGLELAIEMIISILDDAYDICSGENPPNYCDNLLYEIGTQLMNLKINQLIMFKISDSNLKITKINELNEKIKELNKIKDKLIEDLKYLDGLQFDKDGNPIPPGEENSQERNNKNNPTFNAEKYCEENPNLPICFERDVLKDRLKKIEEEIKQTTDEIIKEQISLTTILNFYQKVFEAFSKGIFDEETEDFLKNSETLLKQIESNLDLKIFERNFMLNERTISILAESNVLGSGTYFEVVLKQQAEIFKKEFEIALTQTTIALFNQGKDDIINLQNNRASLERLKEHIKNVKNNKGINNEEINRINDEITRLTEIDKNFYRQEIDDLEKRKVDLERIVKDSDSNINNLESQINNLEKEIKKIEENLSFDFLYGDTIKNGFLNLFELQEIKGFFEEIIIETKDSLPVKEISLDEQKKKILSFYDIFQKIIGTENEDINNMLKNEKISTENFFDLIFYNSIKPDLVRYVSEREKIRKTYHEFKFGTEELKKLKMQRDEAGKIEDYEDRILILDQLDKRIEEEEEKINQYLEFLTNEENKLLDLIENLSSLVDDKFKEDFDNFKTIIIESLDNYNNLRGDYSSISHNFDFYEKNYDKISAKIYATNYENYILKKEINDEFEKLNKKIDELSFDKDILTNKELISEKIEELKILEQTDQIKEEISFLEETLNKIKKQEENSEEMEINQIILNEYYSNLVFYETELAMQSIIDVMSLNYKDLSEEDKKNLEWMKDEEDIGKNLFKKFFIGSDLFTAEFNDERANEIFNSLDINTRYELSSTGELIQNLYLRSLEDKLYLVSYNDALEQIKLGQEYHEKTGHSLFTDEEVEQIGRLIESNLIDITFENEEEVQDSLFKLFSSASENQKEIINNIYSDIENTKKIRQAQKEIEEEKSEGKMPPDSKQKILDSEEFIITLISRMDNIDNSIKSKENQLRIKQEELSELGLPQKELLESAVYLEIQNLKKEIEDLKTNKLTIYSDFEYNVIKNIERKSYFFSEVENNEEGRDLFTSLIFDLKTYSNFFPKPIFERSLRFAIKIAKDAGLFDPPETISSVNYGERSIEEKIIESNVYQGMFGAAGVLFLPDMKKENNLNYKEDKKNYDENLEKRAIYSFNLAIYYEAISLLIKSTGSDYFSEDLNQIRIKQEENIRGLREDQKYIINVLKDDELGNKINNLLKNTLFFETQITKENIIDLKSKINMFKSGEIDYTKEKINVEIEIGKITQSYLEGNLPDELKSEIKDLLIDFGIVLEKNKDLDKAHYEALSPYLKLFYASSVDPTYVDFNPENLLAKYKEIHIELPTYSTFSERAGTYSGSQYYKSDEESALISKENLNSIRESMEFALIVFMNQIEKGDYSRFENNEELAKSFSYHSHHLMHAAAAVYAEADKKEQQLRSIYDRDPTNFWRLFPNLLGAHTGLSDEKNRVELAKSRAESDLLREYALKGNYEATEKIIQNLENIKYYEPGALEKISDELFTGTFMIEMFLMLGTGGLSAAAGKKVQMVVGTFQKIQRAALLSKKVSFGVKSLNFATGFVAEAFVFGTVMHVPTMIGEVYTGQNFVKGWANSVLSGSAMKAGMIAFSKIPFTKLLKNKAGQKMIHTLQSGAGFHLGKGVSSTVLGEDFDWEDTTELLKSIIESKMFEIGGKIVHGAGTAKIQTVRVKSSAKATPQRMTLESAQKKGLLDLSINKGWEKTMIAHNPSFVRSVKKAGGYTNYLAQQGKINYAASSKLQKNLAKEYTKKAAESTFESKIKHYNQLAKDSALKANIYKVAAEMLKKHPGIAIDPKSMVKKEYLTELLKLQDNIIKDPNFRNVKISSLIKAEMLNRNKEFLLNEMGAGTNTRKFLNENYKNINFKSSQTIEQSFKNLIEQARKTYTPKEINFLLQNKNIILKAAQTMKITKNMGLEQIQIKLNDAKIKIKIAEEAKKIELKRTEENELRKKTVDELQKIGKTDVVSKILKEKINAAEKLAREITNLKMQGKDAGTKEGELYKILGEKSYNQRINNLNNKIKLAKETKVKIETEVNKDKLLSKTQKNNIIKQLSFDLNPKGKPFNKIVEQSIKHEKIIELKNLYKDSTNIKRINELRKDLKLKEINLDTLNKHRNNFVNSINKFIDESISKKIEILEKKGISDKLIDVSTKGGMLEVVLDSKEFPDWRRVAEIKVVKKDSQAAKKGVEQFANLGNILGKDYYAIKRNGKWDVYSKVKEGFEKAIERTEPKLINKISLEKAYENGVFLPKQIVDSVNLAGIKLLVASKGQIVRTNDQTMWGFRGELNSRVLIQAMMGAGKTAVGIASDVYTANMRGEVGIVLSPENAKSVDVHKDLRSNTNNNLKGIVIDSKKISDISRIKGANNRIKAVEKLIIEIKKQNFVSTDVNALLYLKMEIEHLGKGNLKYLTQLTKLSKLLTNKNLIIDEIQKVAESPGLQLTLRSETISSAKINGIEGKIISEQIFKIGKWLNEIHKLIYDKNFALKNSDPIKKILKTNEEAGIDTGNPEGISKVFQDTFLKKFAEKFLGNKVTLADFKNPAKKLSDLKKGLTQKEQASLEVLARLKEALNMHQSSEYGIEGKGPTYSLRPYLKSDAKIGPKSMSFGDPVLEMLLYKLTGTVKNAEQLNKITVSTESIHLTPSDIFLGSDARMTVWTGTPSQALAISKLLGIKISKSEAPAAKYFKIKGSSFGEILKSLEITQKIQKEVFDLDIFKSKLHKELTISNYEKDFIKKLENIGKFEGSEIRHQVVTVIGRTYAKEVAALKQKINSKDPKIHNFENILLADPNTGKWELYTWSKNKYTLARSGLDPRKFLLTENVKNTFILNNKIEGIDFKNPEVAKTVGYRVLLDPTTAPTLTEGLQALGRSREFTVDGKGQFLDIIINSKNTFTQDQLLKMLARNEYNAYKENTFNTLTNTAKSIINKRMITAKEKIFELFEKKLITEARANDLLEKTRKSLIEVQKKLREGDMNIMEQLGISGKNKLIFEINSLESTVDIVLRKNFDVKKGELNLIGLNNLLKGKEILNLKQKLDVEGKKTINDVLNSKNIWDSYRSLIGEKFTVNDIPKLMAGKSPDIKRFAPVEKTIQIRTERGIEKINFERRANELVFVKQTGEWMRMRDNARYLTPVSYINLLSDLGKSDKIDLITARGIMPVIEYEGNYYHAQKSIDDSITFKNHEGMTVTVERDYEVIYTPEQIKTVINKIENREIVITPETFESLKGINTESIKGIIESNKEQTEFLLQQAKTTNNLNEIREQFARNKEINYETYNLLNELNVLDETGWMKTTETKGKENQVLDFITIYLSKQATGIQIKKTNAEIEKIETEIAKNKYKLELLDDLRKINIDIKEAITYHVDNEIIKNKIQELSNIKEKSNDLDILRPIKVILTTINSVDLTNINKQEVEKITNSIDSIINSEKIIKEKSEIYNKIQSEADMNIIDNTLTEMSRTTEEKLKITTERFEKLLLCP
jgi:hypothetical protein